MMNLSDAAAAAHPLSIFGQLIEPWSTAAYLVIAVGVFFTGSRLMFANEGVVPLMGVMMIFAISFMMVAFALNDFQDAQLFDAQGSAIGEVTSVNETGGGCTPTRTELHFKDGTGLTVVGSLSITPGETATKKVIPKGTFICRGEGNTTTCNPV
jgi:hypothetical protein